MSSPTISVEENAQAWRGKAERLMAVLGTLQDDALKVSLLNKIAKNNHDLAFPGFLKLLLIVAESDSDNARNTLSDTLASALDRREMPTGELSAWGTRHLWNKEIVGRSSFSISSLNTVQPRHLAPVEYLTVWYCQSTQRPFLSKESYQASLVNLIHLISCNATAKQVYPQRILEELLTAPEGAFTRQTQCRLAILAEAWLAGESPEKIAEAVAA